MVNRPYPPQLNYPSYEVDTRLTEGVIARRFWAYLIDLVVIALWVTLISIGIFFLGIITLGLGWGLFFALPLTALIFIVYNAVTIGGPSQATVGMRYMGLRVINPQTGRGPPCSRLPCTPCSSMWQSRHSCSGPATYSSASSGMTAASCATC
jgi:hypothetical protein